MPIGGGLFAETRQVVVTPGAHPPDADAAVPVDADRRMGAGATMRGIRHQSQEAVCPERSRQIAEGRVADDLGVDPGSTQIGDRRFVGHAEIPALTPRLRRAAPARDKRLRRR
jgi:hypothetical protein